MKAHKRKPKRSKEEIQENLRHEEMILSISEEDKKCKECGSELVYIGKELVRRELHIVPSDAFVLEVYRPKYKCAECEKKTEEAKITTVTPAPLPVRKSMAAASTIAYVMIEKYQMGTPLYRLEKYWNSRGLDLNRNTLARWIILASMWFEPLISSMNRTLMSLDVIHSDETSFQVLKRDGAVTNKLSSMWVIVSGKCEKYQIALYNYRRTKSQKEADELLGDYKGTLISDCYPVYSNLKKCTHSACWAHCRRKFLDAVPSGKKEGKAYEAIQII